MKNKYIQELVTITDRKERNSRIIELVKLGLVNGFEIADLELYGRTAT